jgi:Kef-type K+ transport system membrane component KefB
MNLAAMAAAVEGAMTVPEFLFILVAVLVVAKVMGELAERIGQPAVLGELVAGVLLGASVFGIVDSGNQVLHLFAEIGVILLLFQIGLETDLKRLLSVGPASLLVAIVGVAAPFILGYYVAAALGLDTLPAVVAGASLTATSVGITARVLSDLGRLQDPESQIVLGAAVIDDVIGLIILAIVSQVMGGAELTLGSIAMTTALAFGFLIAVLVVGHFIVPRLFGLLARLGKEETLGTMGVAFAFLVAFLADAAGSALIVGAFAAGLVLAPTAHAMTVEHNVLRLSMFFVPIFFVSVGAAVDVRTFADPQVLMIGGALIAVAVFGKFIAGYAPFWLKVKKSVIGVGMIPRGEVGLIFAQMGITTGALSIGHFSAITLMVMVTTFIAPPLLKLLFPPREGVAPQEAGDLAQVTTEA